ncbi:HAD family phosphatase [Stigmatella sp. ncwal1]|uniref:Beta-phosphoglucomutase n=1 Tax=Stigmatella ashevillensis TaxID=2995309 RepID=A0ABT5DNH3_9BACT|nr:HAD family phosphatase [Stigmatella ashevillena]MDC0715129.1 HAD family phosphatase [Stigmatella ashevillena]
MTAPPRLLAAIFDMDGTLVDNMRFHSEAWVSISRRLGVEATAERFEREFAGKKNEEIFPLLLGRPVPSEELALLALEKETHYRTLYTPHLALMRGAEDFIARLRAAEVRLAVATASPTENRQLVLDGLGIRSTFARVVGAEEVVHGKPAPDIFLAAARDIGVEPAACVVFEDALNGIRAARAAGMMAVGITSTTPPELLREAGAHWTAPDFASLPPELEALLRTSPHGKGASREDVV